MRMRGFFSTQSAIDIYGSCTQEVLETATAWYAVGVGGPFDSTVTANFTSEWQTSCSVPFFAEFINQSANGESYFWSFGDTSSGSSAVNPDHWYNQFGTFDVTLYVDGGICGNDTVTKTTYISLDSTNYCYVILPTSDTAQTQTSCTGTVYDDGGPFGDYSGNTDVSVTISPPGASQIMLLFPHFDMEFGNTGSCNFDFMEIFDGPDTTATSLGQWCNTTGPPDTIISTAGHVTIRQYTDAGLSLSGFEIPWQCIMADEPPIPGFEADLTHTCDGVIQFYDRSIPTPTGWLWDFGDGNTSTLQNPLHQYTVNDSFTVSLTVSDSSGSNITSRIDYIVVERPAMLSTTPDSGCAPAILTLTSSGGLGTTYWYDTIMGGSPIDSGSTLVTPVVNATRSFYVQNHIPVSSQYIGAVDTSIGTGEFNSSKNHMVFDVFRTCTLVSVMVYADTLKDRTIELRNKYGIVINSSIQSIPVGATRITLNFVLTPETEYELGISGTGSRLYRNATGTSYPYTLSDWVTITHCSVANNPTKYYYFFYDWEIEGHDCSSPRKEVIAFIKQDSFNISILGDSMVCEKDSINLSATGGVNYVWSTGDSGTNTITHMPTKSPEDYSVVSYADCSTDTGYHSVTIDSLPVAIFSFIQDSSTFYFTNESKFDNSVSWAFGDGNFRTDQDPVHTYSAPGTYDVVLTVTNNCGNADTTITVNVEEYPSSTLDISKAGFRMHPNPATSSVEIVGKIPGNSVRILITNILGQQAYAQDHQFSNGELSLDITGIPRGLYTIKVITETGQYQQHLIVQ